VIQTTISKWCRYKINTVNWEDNSSLYRYMTIDDVKNISNDRDGPSFLRDLNFTHRSVLFPIKVVIGIYVWYIDYALCLVLICAK